ncbi:MAG: hypothetical protein ACREVI_05925 [Steroidobacteraceae bacterium]
MNLVHDTSLKFLLAASLAVVSCSAHAQAVTTTREGGYEIKRWQVKTMASGSSVGFKTTDYETRVGITPETDGNSRTFVMVVGSTAKKCPTAAGKAAGTFEHSMTVDEVNSDEGETRRTHISNRYVAKLEGEVGDDGILRHIDIVDGEITRERDGAPTERIRLPTPQRIPVNRSGVPEWEAIRRAVLATGDLATAVAILLASVTYVEAELGWLEPNQCVEFAFDPPSNTREVAPGEAVEVRTWLRTFLDQSAVGEATLEASGLNGAQVSPRKTQAPDDGVVTFKYTAPLERRPPRGFDVVGLSRAGTATGEWRALDGVKLVIEHRLLSRRDTPHALAGRPLYDGTVRFELKLEPFPTLPGEFRGETTVVRQFAVAHITPRCTGQGSQTETWRVNATVDAASGTMKLGLAMFGDDLTAYWICDGQQSEVTSPARSALRLMETPLTMPSRSGTRQTFTPSGPLFRETLTVTIP